MNRRTILLLRGAVLAFLLLMILGATVAVVLGEFHLLSLRAISETIRSWGAWGAAASIALMVLHSFVPFPAELLAIANGMIFGPVWGIVVTWTGAMVGAYLAFGLARVLGRPFVEAMVAPRRRRVLDQMSGLRGGTVLLLARFVPIIAFNLINYAAGLTKLSWWTFTWATGIGILPVTALMVVAGDRMGSMTAEIWVMGAAALVAFSWLVLRRRLRSAVTGDGENGKKTPLSPPS